MQLGTHGNFLTIAPALALLCSFNSICMTKRTTYYYFEIFFYTYQVKLECIMIFIYFPIYIKLQRICYSRLANGARNGVISIGQWGVFNREKGAI